MKPLYPLAHIADHDGVRQMCIPRTFQLCERVAPRHVDTDDLPAGVNPGVGAPGANDTVEPLPTRIQRRLKRLLNREGCDPDTENHRRQCRHRQPAHRSGGGWVRHSPLRSPDPFSRHRTFLQPVNAPSVRCNSRERVPNWRRPLRQQDRPAPKSPCRPHHPGAPDLDDTVITAVAGSITRGIDVEDFLRNSFMVR